ncbi:MAG TPA: PolC-type DNA polymerase III [Atopostipes sp.]|nr:PolC-type DNA polymerase III [Atopostipes sp.]
MDSEPKKMFQTLLKQIQLELTEQERQSFDQAEISTVKVHKKVKRWDFYFTFEQILPFSLFKKFETALKLAFANHVEVDVYIQAKNNDVSSQLVTDYWLHACQKSGVDSPICNQLFSSQAPILQDGKWVFHIEHEITQDKFSEEFFPPIIEQYNKLGFPKNLRIIPIVDHHAAERVAQAVIEKNESETAKLTEELTKRHQQNERNGYGSNGQAPEGPIKLGRNISSSTPVLQMRDILEEERSVLIEGYVFDVEVRKLRSERELMIIKMTDYTSSIIVKKFSNNETDEAIFSTIKPGKWLKAQGSIQMDTFSNELTMMAQSIQETFHETKQDTAPEGEKRVELHAHTNMSQMDATVNTTALIEQAKKWGHEAVAITDHGGVYSFPEAYSASKANDIQVIYGLEADLVDDGVPIAFNLKDLELTEAKYVVFDVETTGLSAVYDSIIELAGVKMYKGNVIEEFQEFIDPGVPISAFTTQLTGITSEMVRGSKPEKQVLEEFQAFTEGTILVAHNASFDIGFINKGYEKNNLPLSTLSVIDTLELSRFLYPQFKSFGLSALAKRFDVTLEQHHRAIYDAETTGRLLDIFLKELMEEHEITNLMNMNDNIGAADGYKRSRPTHATLLVKSEVGLKNLYKLVSKSLTEYFYRTPRIPHRVLEEYKEGILVGSGCSNGEVFTTMMQRGYDDAKEVAQKYDFLEVMPKDAYLHLKERELIKNDQDLEEVLMNIVKLGDELGIPVVATGNVHYLNEQDDISRKIILQSINSNNTEQTLHPKVHFRTTDEMLEAFSFLGETKAKEVVVTNSQKVKNMIDSDVKPLKDDLYSPKMEGAEKEIRDMTYDKAKEWYGEDLPEIVEARIERELDSIIGNGFAVIYLISQKLVEKSNQEGYLVGSRGSVGSSFVATLTGITEVNPLAPHYRCGQCQFYEFFEDGSVSSGFDLPPKQCPNCDITLISDGHDIPFETFLGFKGDKVPDIDLNFSGEYQSKAHDYTKELFGEEYVYRAGTIGTIAERTAYGYVKGYEGDMQKRYRGAEIDRLVKGITGVRRTTGQHPGGIIVVPDYMDVFDFTPIQYPANDQESEWFTTHFDFHSIEDNLLKLDILGHDDPTMIRMLEDLSGIPAKDIPLNDPDVMSLFKGPEVMGVTAEQIYSKTGTLGVPEFGTPFVREMLEQTKPETFSELLQISGLSHGTDVWLGNAQELIKKHDIPLSDVIGTRDDIMVYLQYKGVEDSMAFNIMEFVRKGRGIPDEWQAAMRENEVPEWYIESCLKIKYMFPKAHAAAYIIMALRIAYFKVHYPLFYYATFFSIRAKDFDLEAMTGGKETLKAKINEIYGKGLDATPKENTLVVTLEVANEMLERGFNIKMVDLNKSDALDFTIEEDSLIAPFRAVPSLGANVAKQIVEARKDDDFLSKEDLAKRGKVSKTVMEYLTTNNVVNHLPDENQLSLFDF